MTRQLDLFVAASASPLIGLRVKIEPRGARDDRSCCANICSIGAGKGPHAGELLCANCSRHRGWLSKATAHWIETVVTQFGAPTTPIIIRRSSRLAEASTVPHISVEEPPENAGTSTQEQTSDEYESCNDTS